MPSRDHHITLPKARDKCKFLYYNMKIIFLKYLTHLIFSRELMVLKQLLPESFQEANDVVSDIKDTKLLTPQIEKT